LHVLNVKLSTCDQYQPRPGGSISRLCMLRIGESRVSGNF
jgi:hypothetical protein